MTTIYARVTDDGTAASETALCAQHIHRAAEFPGDADVVSDPVDASGNEMLECQVCGAQA